MKQILRTSAEWASLIAICYLLAELGVFKYFAYSIGVIAYLGIGCLISGFAGDQPKPWLESRPVLLTIVHVAIALLWLPLVVLLIIWMIILFILELFGIRLEKDNQ